jgi:hypothetical protein
MARRLKPPVPMEAVQLLTVAVPEHDPARGRALLRATNALLAEGFTVALTSNGWLVDHAERLQADHFDPDEPVRVVIPEDERPQNR